MSVLKKYDAATGQWAPIVAGATGPQGPAGSTNQLGPYPVEFTAPAAGDLLAIGAGKIINVRADTVTDGGNF